MASPPGGISQSQRQASGPADLGGIVRRECSTGRAFDRPRRTLSGNLIVRLTCASARSDQSHATDGTVSLSQSASLDLVIAPVLVDSSLPSWKIMSVGSPRTPKRPGAIGFS